MVDFTDVLASCAGETIPGIALTAFYADHCNEIATWPELPAAPASASQMVTISTSFTMKPTKVFHKLEIQMLSGNIKNTLQGVFGSRSFKSSFAFKLSGNADGKEAFDRKIKNGLFAFVVVENDGTKRLVGTKNNPAMVESIESDSGTDPSKDAYETTYVVIAPVNVGLCPKYTGDVPLV